MKTKLLEILRCSTLLTAPLPFAEQGVHAGFPSPAQDFMEQALDFNRDMVKHPEATFYARVKGDSMQEEGIHDGDMLLIDRSITAESGSLAVCAVDGEFTLKRLLIKDRRIYLMPANKNFKPLRIEEGQEFMVWGVVLYVIKKP